MAGIDDVLERLVTDPDFRSALAADPAATLAGYELSTEDLELLATQLDAHVGSGQVEQRTSKSGLAGILSGFAGGGPSETGGEADYLQIEMKDEMVASHQAGDQPITITSLTDDVYDAPPPGIDDLGAPEGAEELPSESVSFNFAKMDHDDGGEEHGEAADLATRGRTEEAAYIKFEGIDGESTDAEPNRPPTEVIELVPHTITDDETTGTELTGDADQDSPDVSEDGEETGSTARLSTSARRERDSSEETGPSPGTGPRSSGIKQTMNTQVAPGRTRGLSD